MEDDLHPLEGIFPSFRVANVSHMKLNSLFIQVGLDIRRNGASGVDLGIEVVQDPYRLAPLDESVYYVRAYESSSASN